jgi:hypothetical protein
MDARASVEGFYDPVRRFRAARDRTDVSVRITGSLLALARLPAVALRA